MVFQNVCDQCCQLYETLWFISVNLIRMVKHHGIIQEHGFFLLSIVETFHKGHITSTFHCHQCLLPSLVEHLQVVAAHLNAQQVVHLCGSPLYIMDLGDSADHESDLQSTSGTLPLLAILLHLERCLLNPVFIMCMKPFAIWEPEVPHCIRVQTNTDPTSDMSCIELA